MVKRPASFFSILTVLFAVLLSPTWGCGEDSYSEPNSADEWVFVETSGQTGGSCSSCAESGSECCCCSDALGDCAGETAVCSCSCGCDTDPSSAPAPASEGSSSRHLEQQFARVGDTPKWAAPSPSDDTDLFDFGCTSFCGHTTPLYLELNSILC